MHVVICKITTMKMLKEYLKREKGMQNWRDKLEAYSKIVDLDPLTSVITLTMND